MDNLIMGRDISKVQISVIMMLIFGLSTCPLLNVMTKSFLENMQSMMWGKPLYIWLNVCAIYYSSIMDVTPLASNDIKRVVNLC